MLIRQLCAWWRAWSPGIPGTLHADWGVKQELETGGLHVGSGWFLCGHWAALRVFECQEEEGEGVSTVDGQQGGWGQGRVLGVTRGLQAGHAKG